MQQRLADESPRTFASCPRAEELDRVAIRLRPPPICLKRFIEPPAEIFSPLVTDNLAFLAGASDLSRARHCFIPLLFPCIESNAADGIDVRRPSDFMVTG